MSFSRTTTVELPVHTNIASCSMASPSDTSSVQHKRAIKHPIVCPVEGCQKMYTTKSHLKRHASTAHESKLCYMLLICPIKDCHKRQRSRTSLLRHMKRAHGPNNFKCDVCQKGFKKRRQLREHHFRHTGVPAFNCLVCNIGCETSRLLKRHMRGHKSYTCDVVDCGVIVNKWTAMRKHMKNDHPREYQCSNCEKKFFNKAMLRNHVAIHLVNDVRERFQCPYIKEGCGRSYFQERNLTAHVRTYHNKIRFICQFSGCTSEFTSRHRHDAHYKTVHGAMPIGYECVVKVTAKEGSRKKKEKSVKPKRVPRSMAMVLSGLREVPPEFNNPRLPQISVN